MSNQGEQPTSRRGKVVTAIVATVLTLGAVGFGTAVIATANGNAAAHTQLMAGVKVDGQELGAAAEEDAALDATVEAAARANRIQELAAADTAAKVAAEQAAAAAAAAQAAADAAAAQAAKDAAARQRATSSNDEPGDPGTGGASPVWVSQPGNAYGGYWDTSPCGAAGANTNPDGSVSCAG